MSSLRPRFLPLFSTSSTDATFLVLLALPSAFFHSRSDHYKKSGLAPAVHRVKMCELAVESTSTWLMVDPWEAGQGSYQRTAVVLQHFEEELNGAGGGVRGKDGEFIVFFFRVERREGNVGVEDEAHSFSFAPSPFSL